MDSRLTLPCPKERVPKRNAAKVHFLEKDYSQSLYFKGVHESCTV